jgi:Na+/H+-dicarboxylate symporter
VLVYCLKAYRDEYLGGLASYGKLLLMTLAIAVVSSLLSVAYTYVLVNYIDTEYVEKVKQVTIERYQESPRITDAQLDTLIERVETRTTKARIIRQPLVGGIIFTFIIGLIAAAFLKREENPVSNTV